MIIILLIASDNINSLNANPIKLSNTLKTICRQSADEWLECV